MNGLWRVFIVVVVCFVLCTNAEAAKKKKNFRSPQQTTRGAGPTHCPTGKHSRGSIGPRIPNRNKRLPIKPGPPIKLRPRRKIRYVVPWGARLVRIPTRYIVQPYNPNDGTSQEDYYRKIEQMRARASLIQDPYYQFCAFYKLAETTGEVQDLNGCYRAALRMKIKDGNEYLFQLVQISVAMGDLDFAKKATDKIRHTYKKKHAKDLIAKANKYNTKDDDKKSTKIGKKTSPVTTKK